MGASGCGDRIELIVDICEFYRRVGLVASYLDLEWLGLQPNLCSDFFWSEDLPHLQQFCRENPEYHIVSSSSPGRLENRYVPGAQTYSIANGDRNPNLVLNPMVNPKWALVDEEVVCSALAILDKGVSGGE